MLQLNLPWRALYDAIGAATPPSIGMLALEPDPRKRTMKITAEAKSSDAMIEYVELLKREELFSGVTLIRHEINEQDRPSRSASSSKPNGWPHERVRLLRAAAARAPGSG